VIFLADGDVEIDESNPYTDDGINVVYASYVVIEGFTVTGCARAGIRIVGDASTFTYDVTVRSCRTDQNGLWGIFSGYCHDLLVVDNEASRSAAQHGIYLSNSGDRPVVRGNRVWGNTGSGIQLNGDLSAGGDGIISGAVIERNVIYDNGGGGALSAKPDGVLRMHVQLVLVGGCMSGCRSGVCAGPCVVYAGDPRVQDQERQDRLDADRASAEKQSNPASVRLPAGEATRTGPAPQTHGVRRVDWTVSSPLPLHRSTRIGICPWAKLGTNWSRPAGNRPFERVDHRAYRCCFRTVPGLCIPGSARRRGSP